MALAAGIPSARKIANRSLKHLIKKAVRGLVPDEVIDRRKQGFGVPVDELFEGRLTALARRELEAFCAATDLLDRRGVDGLMGTRQGAKVWYLLNVALWWRQYIRA